MFNLFLVLSGSESSGHLSTETAQHVAGSKGPRKPNFSLSFMEAGSVAGYRQLEFSCRWEWWGGMKRGGG